MFLYGSLRGDLIGHFLFKNSQFQNTANHKTLLVKMSFICMRNWLNKNFDVNGLICTFSRLETEARGNSEIAFVNLELPTMSSTDATF